MGTKRAIAAVPSSVKDPSLRRFLESVRTTAEGLLGQRGLEDNRAVLVSDLKTGRFSTAIAAGINATPNVVIDTGGGSSYDPYANTDEPFAPTNVTVSSNTQNVFVRWDSPVQNHIAYAEIWKVGPFEAEPTTPELGALDAEDNPQDPVAIAARPYAYSAIYADSVDPDTWHYYWVRFVSFAGIVGPFHSLTPVGINTKKDPDAYLRMLTDQLNDAQLVVSLRDKIDLSATRSAANNAELLAARGVEFVNDSLADRLDAGDVLLGEVDTKATNAGTQASASLSEITAARGGESSLAARINAVQTTADGAAQSASVTQTEVLQARGSESTLAQRIESIELSANGGLQTYNQSTAPSDPSTGDLWYNPTDNALKRFNGSVWQTVGALNSNLMTDGAQWGNTALWSQVSGAGRPADNADVTGENTALNTLNVGALSAAQIAAGVSSANFAAQEVTAAQDGDTLAARFVAVEGVASEAAGIAQTLETELVSAATSAGNIANYLQQTRTIANDANGLASATNTQITNAVAQVPGATDLTAAVQIHQSAIAGLEAQWTAKTQVGDLVGGIGLYNDGSNVLFAVTANRFAFLNPNDSLTAPFVVDNGVTVMDGAYIKEATINVAAIDQITTSDIVGLNASFITANINDASITSAKLSAVIQSDNYVQGTVGWQINRGGHAEFNDIAIYDPGGTLAFASGQNYLVTVDSVNTDVWLSEYYDFIIQEPGLGVKGLKLESYPNGIIPEEDYSYYNFGISYGVVVGSLAAAFDDRPYTVSTKAHRVYSGRNYTVELDFLPDSPRVGSYQIRAYEYDSDLASGVEYVVGATVGQSDPQCVLYDRSLLIDTSAYPQAEPYDVVLSEAYTPSSTARWVSFALEIPSNGPDFFTIKTFGLKGQRTQVSSTFIEDAAIKAAHIEDASITSAKIKKAAIETLTIMEGAVTAISVATPVDGSGQYAVLVASMTFNHGWTETIPTRIDVSGSFQKGEGGEEIQYAVGVDETWSGFWGTNLTMRGYGGTINGTYIYDMPPGDHVVRFYGRRRIDAGSIDSINWQNVVLAVQGVKR